MSKVRSTTDMAVAVEVRGEAPRAPEARELSWIFDIPIDLGRPEDLLGRITQWARQDGAGPRLPRRVMYANAHVLNESAGNHELRTALESADLVYCDGYGVRLAAKALDAPIPQRIDRKSTRLNSSHANISYAVFWLKKNKKIKECIPL